MLGTRSTREGCFPPRRVPFNLPLEGSGVNESNLMDRASASRVTSASGSAVRWPASLARNWQARCPESNPYPSHPSDATTEQLEAYSQQKISISWRSASRKEHVQAQPPIATRPL